ncbi:hypothetical protein [uncultured Ruegeria sp.]|uniref:hypothetical protein n=1 Tax=uncultured Ruegeria sp. TaxID=259304 RepID=UPI00260867F8|nr:hypothetical protein [uncultured Ruegeria sp.]
MKLKYSAATLVLLAACDVPAPTAEEAKQQEQTQQQLQELQQQGQDDLYRQQLELECFDGDKKACDNQQKLQEIDAAGDALEGVAEAASAGG